MSFFVRLIAVALAFAACVAHAVVPSTTVYVSPVWPDVSGPTLSAFCSAAAGKSASLQTTPQCKYGTAYCTFVSAVEGTACYTDVVETGARYLIPYTEQAVCPQNSEMVGGSCVCKAGFTEKNGACVAPEKCVTPLVEVNGKCSCPAGTKEETDATGLRQCKPDSVCSEMAGKPLGLPVTADYGSKSPSALGRMIGKPSTTCFPGGGCRGLVPV